VFDQCEANLPWASARKIRRTSQVNDFGRENTVMSAIIFSSRSKDASRSLKNRGCFIGDFSNEEKYSKYLNTAASISMGGKM
jgi:hypothetical protein